VRCLTLRQVFPVPLTFADAFDQFVLEVCEGLFGGAHPSMSERDCAAVKILDLHLLQEHFYHRKMLPNPCAIFQRNRESYGLPSVNNQPKRSSIRTRQGAAPRQPQGFQVLSCAWIAVLLHHHSC